MEVLQENHEIQAIIARPDQAETELDINDTQNNFNGEKRHRRYSPTMG